MRKVIAAMLATTLLCTSIPALADHGYRGHDRGHERHHRGGGNSLSGLAIFGALAGVAIGTAIIADRSRPVYVQPYAEPIYVQPAYRPQPVYIEQQPVYSAAPPVDPANTEYYCGSSSMYYPETQACPEGWQAVAGRAE